MRIKDDKNQGSRRNDGKTGRTAGTILRFRNRLAYVLAAVLLLEGVLPGMQASAADPPAAMEREGEEAAGTVRETGETSGLPYSAAAREENASEGPAGNRQVPAMTPLDAERAPASPSNSWKDAQADAAPQTGSQGFGYRLTGTALLRIAAPDPWTGWNGDMDFPGDGTEEAPYQIRKLSHLMGLSQAVAGGESFEGVYFELTNDIDLSGISVNSGNWNPIGWYGSGDDADSRTIHPFCGIFDGAGHTIRGLRIVSSEAPLQEIGLFGVIDGGTVKNLKILDAEVSGTDRAAVLAGTVRGGAVIYGVTVSGHVSVSDGDAGGITAVADGNGERVTIENCSADGIVIQAGGTDHCAGGIAGVVREADLADNLVKTWEGGSDRIQGAGYVGGIAGSMEAANLYNSYVDGVIGGNGSRAVGGIAGQYLSGNLVVARFAGDIGHTGMGGASYEGTFIGTRDKNHPFSYGTEPGDNLAYLFADSEAAARQVCGADFDEDNTFYRDAHVGYWQDYQRTYVLLSGNSQIQEKDRFFYEELEDGVRSVITGKLELGFAPDGTAAEQTFRLDHFAPGQQGQPVRGYVLSVPRIDARNANGTYDTDVASLTVMPQGNQSYYRAIDKNHPAAVAPGVTVTVVTAPNNRDGNRYQMAADPSGGVKAPVYINDAGRETPMSYLSAGTYSFRMPERDTEINAEYVKVTTVLTMAPAETQIFVTQIRTGDRKNPDTVTEVRNSEGLLIARYIEDALDESIQVQPVRIHSQHNETGGTADQTVKWSVDNTDLIDLVSEAGYTEQDARILPNLSGSFIQDTLKNLVQAQIDGGYQEAISPTVYQKWAVVTASSNPETSADQVAVLGNCKVGVSFQILDRTTRRVEGMQLNQSDLTITVTRRLTGNRLKPEETILCSEPVVLSAVLYPEQPFYKNVSWRDQESGAVLLLIPEGANTSQCSVSARFDAAGLANPAWIQNVINADNQKRKEDPHAKLEGTAVHTETVTATSEDQTHGVVSAACKVTVRFVTEDQTVLRSTGNSSGGSTGSSSGGSSSESSSSGGSSSGSGKKTAASKTGTEKKETKTAGTNAELAGGKNPATGAWAAMMTGVWSQEESGRWTFAAGEHACRGEWAFIFNPYADSSKGQVNADWFYFDEQGYMATGWKWLTGADGLTRCYYFNEVSDGTKGSLLRSTVTPDNYQVNGSGAWMIDGMEQFR